MAAKLLKFPVSDRLECTGCGAHIDALCNCGVAYVPARQRAADSISANPSKSDRAIAADAGVSRETVRMSRKSGDKLLSPDKRIGRDGKSYPGKGRKKDPTTPDRRKVRKTRPDASDPRATINAFHHELLTFLADFSDRLNTWHGAGPEISDEGKASLMNALYLCSDGLARLSQKLDGR